VYFVLPWSSARFAASFMLFGVSKSGSPADKEIMSLPSAASFRAFVETAMVADGCMRLRLSAMKPMDHRPVFGFGLISLMRNGGGDRTYNVQTLQGDLLPVAMNIL
jgi:hypothetical protein